MIRKLACEAAAALSCPPREISTAAGLPRRAPEAPTDFYFVEADEPEAIHNLLVRLVKERIPARFGFDPKGDIQVLTPTNRSLLGARNLNQVLQAAINPGDGGPEVQRFGWTYRIGDRVIQTENDYDRDVFNGDLGVIEKINRIEQVLHVDFEGRSVEYDFGDLDELSLAYVLSIHKSQSTTTSSGSAIYKRV